MKAQEADSLGLYSTRLRVYRINCDGQKSDRLKKIYTETRAAAFRIVVRRRRSRHPR